MSQENTNETPNTEENKIRKAVIELSLHGEGDQVTCSGKIDGNGKDLIDLVASFFMNHENRDWMLVFAEGMKIAMEQNLVKDLEGLIGSRKAS